MRVNAHFLTAVFFLEYWKRKEITLAYQWDVLGFEEEEVLYMRLNDFFMYSITCLKNHLSNFVIWNVKTLNKMDQRSSTAILPRIINEMLFLNN